MDGDLIEKAKSNRSRCTTCGVAIDQGELRFGAIVVEGHDFMEWHHLACAQQAMADRIAPVLAAANVSAADVPPAPDAGLARLERVERAPSGRARCHACNTAIAAGALRVVIRLEPDPANPEFARKGYIHLACAPAFTGDAGGLHDYLAKRATPLAKDDRASVPNLFVAARLVATDPRARELGAQGAHAVLADWFEGEHDLVIAPPDIAQLPGVAAAASGELVARAKPRAAKRKKAAPKPAAAKPKPAAAKPKPKPKSRAKSKSRARSR